MLTSTTKLMGLMQEQHMDIFSWVCTLMETTPVDLLPCHCHLLDKNFHDLGNTETIQPPTFGLPLWNQLSAPPAVSPPVISHQAASQYSTHRLAVGNLEDLLITTLKPHLGPCQIPHAVPVNRHTRRHFGSLLDHNPHERHLRTLITLTLLARTIAYTGKENCTLILIQVWSDLCMS
jgi:hypothetical protein